MRVTQGYINQVERSRRKTGDTRIYLQQLICNALWAVRDVSAAQAAGGIHGSRAGCNVLRYEIVQNIRKLLTDFDE